MNCSASSKSVMVVNGFDAKLKVGGFSTQIDYDDAKKFVDEIPQLFKNAMGVIFNVFNYQANGYDSNMDFCEAVKSKMNDLQIECYFDAITEYVVKELLVEAGIDVQPHDVVFVVFIMDKKLVISEYIYTEYGYKRIADRTVPYDNDPKLLRENVLGSSNPKQIVLQFFDDDDNKANIKYLRSVFESQKLTVFDKVTPKGGPSERFIAELSKWFSKKSYTKFYILPTCARTYYLNATSGSLVYNLVQLGSIKQPLPFEKSFLIFNSTKELTFGYVEDGGFRRNIELKEQCHQYKITFLVDVNNFLDVKYETILLKQICDLPQNLNAKMEKRIPVIGMMADLSVICIPKDDGYVFLDEWNNVYGKNLVISFAEEKPLFCDNVAKLFEKRESVVYDLLKIMSYPLDEIKKNEKWPFTITKDDEHPVLLQWNNFDGTQKAASPAFLMALLLKQHLKAIKKELGEKPKEICICLLQDYKEDEKYRIQQQLEESCKLLKRECVFVNV